MTIVFLDRDGVLNQYPGDSDYVTKVKDLHIFPKALGAVKRLNQAKIKVFVISNQACVGRGIISQDKLNKINGKLLKAAARKRVKFDGIFYCTHQPDAGCDCRKPGIGNVKKALASIGKSLAAVKQGYFVGDTDKDIAAGHKAGLKTILVETGRDNRRDAKQWAKKPHYIVKDLNAAVDIICS